MRYTIFGAGPSGLYTAWRLATSGRLSNEDSIELIEWGNYAFEPGDGGTRLPAGRICSHHYQEDVGNSYVELGGMRYLEWNPDTHRGHRLVTATVAKLGMQDDIVPFLTTDDPLFYLRQENFYQKQLGKDGVKAPYNTPGNNEKPSDVLVNDISNLMTDGNPVDTRSEQCRYYAGGKLSENINSFVFDPGNTVGNIGYWNFFYDQAGNEGFNYAADAGGYSSNVINWNAANAAVYNREFAPGEAFKTFKSGYSGLFIELFAQTRAAARTAGIELSLKPGTRLHSIWIDGGVPTYRTASAADPFAAKEPPEKTDCAFLAMPRHCVELVAQATRYSQSPGTLDFLNATPVQNYLQSVLEQPSYKVAMFFAEPWWEHAKFPPKLTSSEGVTNVFGPTITDLPLRQIYYFGNNAPTSDKPVYALLASYDDMRFTGFWREMELRLDQRRTVPLSQDYQALQGGRAAPPSMVDMLLLELAKVHYNDPNAAATIPRPLETVFMDWGLNPFGAGYHAWAAHFDICDVMQEIRRPAVLAGDNSMSKVYLIGSAYSNDQAWVEGAFCTAESVLNDFLDIPPLVPDPEIYPLICR